MKISNKFFVAVKTSKTKIYTLALNAGMSPSTLSQILHGMIKVSHVNIQKLEQIGKTLNLKPNEIFEA